MLLLFFSYTNSAKLRIYECQQYTKYCILYNGGESYETDVNGKAGNTSIS